MAEIPNRITAILDGEIHHIDWVMWEGKAWLVSSWILSPDGKSMRPARIVSMRLAQGYHGDLGEAPLRFFEQEPISSDLLHKGLIPTGREKLYEVREAPPIDVPNPDATH
jgi:hypothetical protein